MDEGGGEVMVVMAAAERGIGTEVDLPIALVRSLAGLGSDRAGRGRAVEIVGALARDPERWQLPQGWLEATALALSDDRCDLLSAGFVREEFLGPTGRFLLVGPYTINREGQIVTLLSACYGTVIPHPPLPDLDGAVRTMFGELRQPVTKILPISCLASCGNIGGEAGEAFIVPDGWGFPGSVEGPALNDMGEQRRRFVDGGTPCIETIFTPGTADLLLELYDTPEEQTIVQHEEYQFHEGGHASGVGLTAKLSLGLLPTFWHAAVEEWRSDGVAFELAGGMLGAERAGQLVASNFCTRFGVDSHRLGGSERDRDVAASLMTLDRSLRGGGFALRGGKLALRDCSYRGLFAATSLQRADALELTRREMALGHEHGVRDGYGALGVEASSRIVFEGVVRDACAGVFKKLR